MTSTTPLQDIIDPFVTACGGELVASLLKPTKAGPPRQADYLFRARQLIAELKALEVDTFGEPFRQKMAQLFRDWHQKGLIRVYGTTKVELQRLPAICQQECLDMMAGPLQDIVKKANRQIGSTKGLLGMPSAKGLLWVASDGNEDLQPRDVWFFLTRILKKKTQDGSPQYSNVNGVAYFNPRMPVQVPGTTTPGLVWFGGSRDQGDADLNGFLEGLGEAWIRYNERYRLFGPIARSTAQPGALHFAGVTPKMPRIDMNERTPNDGSPATKKK